MMTSAIDRRNSATLTNENPHKQPRLPETTNPRRMRYIYKASDAQSNLYRRASRVETDLYIGPVELFFHFLLNNCLLNGMFTLSRLLGYTQFMVFIIIRLIITGSLAGRLFGNDTEHTICFSTNNLTEASNRISIEQFLDEDVLDPLYNSEQVKRSCLRVAYHDTISPLVAWALTLVPASLPWLCLIPWTPFDLGRDYIVCASDKGPWPCLTIYMSTFIRAMMRLLLEITAFVGVIALYRMYIPNVVTCYDESVTCFVLENQEMICFLWLLTIINVVSGVLSAVEIVHMQSHSEKYERDAVETYTFREIRLESARRSLTEEEERPKRRVRKWQGSWDNRAKDNGRTERASVGDMRPSTPPSAEANEVFAESSEKV